MNGLDRAKHKWIDGRGCIHLKHFFDVLFPVHVMEGFDDLVMADTRVFHKGIKQFLDLIGNSIKFECLL